jgi:hypothetical protein
VVIVVVVGKGDLVMEVIEAPAMEVIEVTMVDNERWRCWGWRW